MSPDEALSECPPSAKLVYKVLEYNDALTQQQISDESMLAPRTVRHALSELQEENLIEQRVYIADARKKLYSLSERADAESAAA